MSVRVVTVPLTALVPNPVQPAGRVTNVRGLRKEVEQTKTIYPLLVVDNGNETFTVCDGHRRWAVASVLGITKVPCYVLPAGTDVRAAFSSANKETLKVSGNQWGQVWANGGKNLPTMQKRNIEQVVGWLGATHAKQFFLDRNVAPSIAHSVSKALNVQTTYPGIRLKNGPLSGAEIFSWLLNHNGQNSIAKFVKHVLILKGQQGARELLTAVRENRPVNFSI
jgi:hypothetical protein